MGETGLVKLDSVDLSQKIGKILQDKFAELIPDETWRAMVEKEIKSFFEKIPSSYSSTPDSPSHFEKIMREEMEKIIGEKIRTTLSSVNLFQYSGNADITDPEGLITKIAKEVAPRAFEGMVASICQNMNSQVQNY